MILKDLPINKEESNDLKVVEVKLKDNFVRVTLSDNKDEYKLLVSLDDYLNFKIKENAHLSFDSYNLLKEKETLIMAYKSAVRRLGIKDYSEKKMRDALFQKYKLSRKELDSIINDLKSHDYLNDERFTKYRIESLLNQSISKRMIYKKLKDDGIDEDLINKLFPKDNKEKENISIKANKYLKTIKNKPVNAKKKMILSKLINDGFDLSLAKDTIEHLNFKEDEKGQIELLIKQKDKAILKYSKKYEGYDLKNKVYAYLISKGFNSDEVSEILNREEFS